MAHLNHSKTALFFGTFNPIHVGHLIIANHIVENTPNDELWFVVSPQSPFKKKESLLADHHRFALVNLAVEDHPKLWASNIEFGLPKPSYTSHTLSYLEEKYPMKEFSLVMGEDNLEGFDKWKNYEYILENYQIYVYPRLGIEKSKFINHPHVHLLNDIPLLNISASFIRQNIKQKKDVKYLLVPSVYDYVKEMHFYEK